MRLYGFFINIHMAASLVISSHALRSGLLGPATLPAHQRSNADVGSAFFWEQRFWLDFLHVRDHSSFRKDEIRTGHIVSLSQNWGIAQTDFVPGEPNSVFKTRSFSSAMLISWLLSKVHLFSCGLICFHVSKFFVIVYYSLSFLTGAQLPVSMRSQCAPR